jgi:hypothetical protein
VPVAPSDADRPGWVRVARWSVNLRGVGLFLALDLATWLAVFGVVPGVYGIVLVETLHLPTEAEYRTFDLVLQVAGGLRLVLAGALVARWLRRRSGSRTRLDAVPTVLVGALVGATYQGVLSLTTLALTGAGPSAAMHVVAPVLSVGCAVLGALCVAPARRAAAPAPDGYVST